MTTYQLAPLRDLVLVRLRPLPEKVGLIHVPSQHQETAREADVLAVGPEVLDVAVGSAVLVSVLTGQVVGEDILLPESSVLGYLEETTDE